MPLRLEDEELPGPFLEGLFSLKKSKVQMSQACLTLENG